jgi:hypothetical protein
LIVQIVLWKSKRQNMACDALTRAAAKTKRQKWRVKQIISDLTGLATRQIIFAFCLLPFAFVHSTPCATSCACCWSATQSFGDVALAMISAQGFAFLLFPLLSAVL